jgi:glutamate-1-semialdehyde 2,1-aminomutase
MSTRYKRSEAWLERALRSIPLGTQTFSKSRTQFPLGVSPFFLTKGQGCRVWDLDGNEYTDFINSLCSITLGYNDPDVNSAVKAQLEDGVIFSLPHPLEVLVAEKIIEMVPCAEMVRFGKNGSDATTGAIRLARAYTGRNHVAVCGYHGWHDWYIGSTARHLGVPEITRQLTSRFEYNDLPSLEAVFRGHPKDVAAVMLEPMNVLEPAPGFLAGVKDLAHENGALLVFDETITGFRYANGGAQEYFGIIPDLVTLGKGIANGYPLSALAGRASILKLLEEVFFSFTFGGETLSLAASLATLTKLQTRPILDSIAKQGSRLKAGIGALIEKHSAQGWMSIAGHPSWSFLLFRDAGPYTSWQLKTLFLQEVFARGILTLGSHNMSYAHQAEDVDRLLGVYDQVFALLQRALAQEKLQDFLRCPPLEPLFKVR